MNDLCTDIGYGSLNKYGEELCGDHVDAVEQGESSTVVVLADGLAIERGGPHGEELDLSKPYRYVDPNKPWKNQHFENCTAKELQILVMK